MKVVMCWRVSAVVIVASVTIVSFGLRGEYVGLAKTGQLYKEIANGTTIRTSGTRATFSRGGYDWTIVGAMQDRNPEWDTTAHWEISDDYEIWVLRDPFSPIRILPYSEFLSDAEPGGTIRITAFRGEYEPASFVIRTGNRPIANMRVRIANTVCTEGPDIPKGAFDIRVVKVWFQAAKHIMRIKGEKKQLVPELLLHDADIVRVDLDRQVNLIRNYNRMKDAPKLVPFDIPAKTNQQVWVTLHVPLGINPGVCTGAAEVIGEAGTSGETSRKIPISVRVLPGTFKESPLMHAMYYVGGKEAQKPTGTMQDVNGKNARLIDADLEDIRTHGNTNVLLMHDSVLEGQKSSFVRPLAPLLSAIRRTGFRDNTFLYRDRNMTAANSPSIYANKIIAVTEAARRRGFSQTLVYNFDEATLDGLLEHKHSFQITHDIGSFNFTTIRPEYANVLRGLLDIGIIHRNKSPQALISAGIIPWAYNNPQAGTEVPFEMRWKYGFGLWLDGYNGACGFAYQTGRASWDDWAAPRSRPHNMAYPTIDTPIPTIQWEAWREGIDDLRYLNTAAAIISGNHDLKKIRDRREFIKRILSWKSIKSDAQAFRSQLRDVVLSGN